MSAPKKRLNEYFVQLPDLPSAPRTLQRTAHLARAVPMALRCDFFRMGGACLSHHIAGKDPAQLQDAELPFVGSAMLVTAESEEQVREILREDPYVTGGVWDLEKARIWW
ncbi:hypothetical protein BDZ91DRAFT_650213 [Kalaharituber pfeilii]|nr:hypothetical protein BDZ91DRAFT_650213 [Kalaharituber pfeilii]